MRMGRRAEDRKRILLLSNSTQFGCSYLDHAEREIREFLGSIERVLFFPFAMPNQDAYAARNQERFSKMGYGLDSIHASRDGAGAIDAAGALFIGGGNTFRLLTALYERNLLEAIRRRVEAGVPYLGSSAGTVVACPTLKTTNDMPIVEPRSFAALGLIDFQINPHYVDTDAKSTHMGETRKQRLDEFVEQNEEPVVALREGAMLRIERGAVKLKGSRSALIFRKGEVPMEVEPGAVLNI